MTNRWGMTVPLTGVPLADHAPVYAALEAAGIEVVETDHQWDPTAAMTSVP